MGWGVEGWVRLRRVEVPSAGTREGCERRTPRAEEGRTALAPVIPAAAAAAADMRTREGGTTCGDADGEDATF